MICRYWRGWTAPERANDYQRVLTTEVIPMIEAKKMTGFRKIEMMRRDRNTGGDLEGDHGGEVEFATIMWFDDWDSVTAFTGEDYEVAHVPAVAQAVLKRWDERAAHYEVFGVKDY